MAAVAREEESEPEEPKSLMEVGTNSMVSDSPSRLIYINVVGLFCHEMK